MESYWIDIDELEPKENQYIFYIAQEDIEKYKYDDVHSKWWCFDFGVSMGTYMGNRNVEYHYDLPYTKIKYWFPAMKFKGE